MCIAIVCRPGCDVMNFENTVRPLNNGHQRALQNLSVIERCPLLGGNLKKIVIFRT